MNRRLIEYLTRAETKWPDDAFKTFRKRRNLGVEKPANALLSDYLEIELIAERTHVVSGLIYYPFLVLFLMILSRVSLFDNWDWPISLVLVLLFNGSFAAWSAFELRGSAERARQLTLQRLGNLLIVHTAAGGPSEAEVKIIPEIAEAIRAEDRGAFAAISHHPILGAILLPSGGLGIWALAKYLPKLLS